MMATIVPVRTSKHYSLSIRNMRTKEEILEHEDSSSDRHTVKVLLLEVLIDIRDLLTPQTMTLEEVKDAFRKKLTPPEIKD